MEQETINEYKNGKIYGVRCNTSGKLYIGSTILSLNRRLKKHIYENTSFKNGKRKSKCTIFEILENKNYEIFLIEAFPCDSKTELLKRESYHQINNECVNKMRAYVDYDSDYYKEFYQRHKDYNKNYYKENKENLKSYHKDYGKKWYEKNKIEIECECGWKGMKYSLKRHQRTSKKHQK